MRGGRLPEVVEHGGSTVEAKFGETIVTITLKTRKTSGTTNNYSIFKVLWI